MNAKDLKEVLPPIIKARVSTMIWGRHGIGKSQIVRNVAYEMFGEKNADGTSTIIDLRLGQMEIGDLTGIPRNREIDGITITEWGLPDWWPREGTHGVLFIDEMNRASTPDVLQASFQLVLDHRLHTHALPKGWSVISANNPPEDEYQVQTFDPALLDRFLQIVYSPTASDWITWSEKNVDSFALREFVISNNAALGIGTAPKINVTPSPRSYELLDRILSVASETWTDKYLSVIASGLIGTENALALVKFMKSATDRPIAPQEILDNWSTHKPKIEKWAGVGTKTLKNVRSDILKAQLTSVLSYSAVELKANLSKAQLKNLIDLLDLLPIEITSSALQEIGRDETKEKSTLITAIGTAMIGTPLMKKWTRIQEKSTNTKKSESVDDSPL